jgi:nucleotide-binding universal stress UspA family protein
MRRLLVPLDGSERGDQVLTFLDRMVPELRATELVLIRVVTEGAAIDVARERLEATARRHRSAGLKVRTLTILADDPASTILEVAALVRPSLVSLSTQGAGQTKHHRGSVAAKVVERCPVPVLVVGRQALPLDPGPGLSRVLVALDGSRGADAVLPVVGQLARPSDAEVVLLTVEGGEGDGDGGGAGVDLEVARAKLMQEGVDRVRVLRAKGDVAPALLEVARREAVDLLAMGARGRTGGEGLGSVASAVAQGCDCPLLLAR